MSTETEERNKAVVREVNEPMVRLLQAFPDLAIRIETIVAEGDHVAIHAWYEGTHKGELMGYKPSGKRLQFQVVSMDRLEDGRVVQHNAEAGFARAIFQVRSH